MYYINGVYVSENKNPVQLKTINGESLTGSGNIEISGSGIVDGLLSETSKNPILNKVVTEAIKLINDNMITSEEVEDSISSVEENILNSVLIKNSQILTSSEQEQVRKNIDAQKELTLTVKDNGNIVIGNLQGQTKEFMPATPSGDPMHYAYIAAGAEYNNSGADKTKTAPWGESVTHKAGHYYLNGLGDITEEMMAKIYSAPHNAYYPFAYKNTLARTTIIVDTGGQTSLSVPLSGWFSFSDVEVVGSKGYLYGRDMSLSRAFSMCTKLKRILFEPFICRSCNMQDTFSGCYVLVEVRLHNLGTNVSFSDSPLLSKESVLCAIKNASPTSAITITLHPDAYARFMGGEDSNGVTYEADSEIQNALINQPLVSLSK